MATKPMELMLEQVDYVNIEKDGQQKEFVAVRPRIRGDVEANIEKGNAGYYPAGKPGKSSKSQDKQQNLRVENFNKMMEKIGSDIRAPKGGESAQLVGKDTPDNERPVMKAEMQGFKREVSKDENGKERAKTVPSSNAKDIEVYRISGKSVQKSDFPEFSKEAHHKGISDMNKALREKEQATKEQEAKETVEKDNDPELPFE